MKSEIPNITGWFQCMAWGDVNFTGAFSNSRAGYTPADNPKNNRYMNTDFNASWSNDRYGSYTEVNPLYESCLMYIRY